MSPPATTQIPFREIRDANNKRLLLLNRTTFRELELALRDGNVTGVVSGFRFPWKDRAPVLQEFAPVRIPFRSDTNGSSRVDETALAQLMEGFPAAIGYFRILLETHPEISAEDYRVMQVLFGDLGGLLILIHPALNLVHVFERETGTDLHLLCRFSLHEPEQSKADEPTPWSVPEPNVQENPDSRPRYEVSLQPNPPPITPPSPVPLSPLPPSPVPLPPLPPSPAPSEAPRQGKNPRRWFVLTAFVLVALSGILFLKVSPGFKVSFEFKAPQERTIGLPHIEPPKQNSSAPVELSVRKVASGVELTWDVANEAVQTATGASLIVFENNTSRRRSLNPDQLHAGAYFYTPARNETIFQLIFHQPNNKYVVAAAMSEGTLPQSVPVHSPTQVRNPAVKPSPIASPRTVMSAPESVPSRKPPLPYTPPANTPPAGNTQAAVTQPPPANPPPQEPQTPPRTPAATGSGSPTTSQSAPIPITTQPPTAPLPAPASPAVVPPASSAPARETAKESPRPAFITDPVPVRRAMPSFPAHLRTLLTETTTVSVTVTVDPTGKVTNATIAANQLGAKLLAPYALQAAKMWQFQPARQSGVAVESQTVILFRFTK
ncbi:MAG TPA: TonB family protein [Bryobacteraceae bacterium]|nr:TonB family protein [Bryobacteraceae bacterium]